MKRWISIVVVVASGMWFSSPAAAKGPKEGMVVKTGSGELVVDVGRDDGLNRGGQVWVYRRLVVTHPATGKEIEDRFPIGVIQLDEVGERLSIARDWSNLSHPPKPGDYVVVEPAAPPKPKEPEPSTAGAKEPTPDRAVDRAFEETLGRSVPDRIEVWQRFLVENPESPWAEEARNELRWLRVTLSQQRARAAAADRATLDEPDDEPRKPEDVDGEAFAPAAVRDGMPISIDTTVRRPEQVDRVRLHVRRADELTYETIEMTPVGDYNWTVELDPERWSDPGGVEYFTEVIRKDGQVEEVLPSDGIARVHVQDEPEDPIDPMGRSRATLLGEYVDFKAGAGEDQFVRFEAEYRYHLGIPFLHSFAAGAGTFRGTGGTLEEVEAGETRTMLLSYGFAETEFQFAPIFGLNARVLVGNNQRLGVPNSVFEDAFGASGELRFGQSRGTKLLVGAAFTRTVGAEAWITLDIEAIENVPMSGEVIVTNLPVGGDLGVSLNYGAGYEFTDWFALMGRVGWNARTIDHHGPSAGLTSVFNW